MAKNVIINGVTYSNVPRVDMPQSGGGTASFYDTSPSTASAGDILNTKKAFGASGEIDGSMPNNGSVSGTISTKAGTVTVPAGYTSGGTIGIDSAEQDKIVSSNIKDGASILGVNGSGVVKDVSDGTTATVDTVLAGYYFYAANGTLTEGGATVPTVSQDSTTKVLTIQ